MSMSVRLNNYFRGCSFDPSTVIVQLLESVSADDSNCPCCGASGKHIQYFVCADGVRRGAMAGCIKKFRVLPCATDRKMWEQKLKKFPGWRKALDGIAFAESEANRLIEAVRIALDKLAA